MRFLQYTIYLPIESNDAADSQEFFDLSGHVDAGPVFRQESRGEKEHGEASIGEFGFGDPARFAGGFVVFEFPFFPPFRFESVQGGDLLGQFRVRQSHLAGDIFRNPITVSTEFGIPIKVILEFGEFGTVRIPTRLVIVIHGICGCSKGRRSPPLMLLYDRHRAKGVDDGN